MFTVIIPNSAKKDIKKLDKPVISKILELLENLAQNPFQGSPLTGHFSNLLKFELKHKGIIIVLPTKSMKKRLKYIYFMLEQEKTFTMN